MWGIIGILKFGEEENTNIITSKLTSAGKKIKYIKQYNLDQFKEHIYIYICSLSHSCKVLAWLSVNSMNGIVFFKITTIF